MGKRLYAMTEDIQAQIQETAYLMWESAGRQHGMAMEYWLKAESDMLSTVQAATAKMISSMSPGGGKATTATPATVRATPVTTDPAAGKAPPRVETVRQQVSEPVQPRGVKAAPEVTPSASVDIQTTDKKQPPIRKPAVRNKLKA